MLFFDSAKTRKKQFHWLKVITCVSICPFTDLSTTTCLNVIFLDILTNCGRAGTADDDLYSLTSGILRKRKERWWGTVLASSEISIERLTFFPHLPHKIRSEFSRI
jgi:hypothetical protein